MIKDLRAIRIYNSAGRPALALSVLTDKYYTASVPSGTSRGANEAVELPLEASIRKIEKLKPKLLGLDETQREDIEYLLQKEDGTPNFANLGGNVTLAISLCIAKAAAHGELWSLFNRNANTFPYPVGNVVGGGAHGGSTDIQEFLVIPAKANSIEDAVKTNQSIRVAVGEKIGDAVTGKNFENAWTTTLDDTKTLDVVCDVAKSYGARVGIDMAATQFFSKGRYDYEYLNKSLDPGEQLEFVKELVNNYKLAFAEDVFHEADFAGFAALTREVGNRCLVVGDDLYCTNYGLLEKGIGTGATNGIIIKANQSGLLSLVEKVTNLAKRANMACAVSHRSVETEDSWMADLAVGLGCEFIKIGIVGKERETKHNRLIKIWGGVERPRMAKLPL